MRILAFTYREWGEGVTIFVIGNIELKISSSGENSVTIEAVRRPGSWARWLGFDDKTLFSWKLSGILAAEVADSINNMVVLAGRPELKKWRDYSFKNEDEILSSEVCGCYHCLETFPPVEIFRWTTERDGRKTARCPLCGMDSVLPSIKVPFLDDKTILPLLEKIYF
jgi:hypothetical protein